MSTTASFNLAFRPESYWDPTDAETAILSGVTGQLRRQMVRDFIRGDASTAFGELDDSYMADTLTPDDRTRLGLIHPQFMGGEYLPAYRRGEVEIARIVLQSVTMDIYSVRARRGGGRIHYRIVDEYETDFVLTRKSSKAPLTMAQLIALIDTASCYDYSNVTIAIREMNLESGSDIDEMRDFVSVESLFYPELEAHYEQAGEQWAEQKVRERREEWGEEE